MKNIFKFMIIFYFMAISFSFANELNGVINFYNAYNESFASSDLDSLREEGLQYLNQLRNSAGLDTFSENTQLDESAQNHAQYLLINNTITHIETEGRQYFTGATPTDRAFYTGYESALVSENLSAGSDSVKNSIDDLFSAIYHRFGFLNFNINEIGIGYAYSSSSIYKTFYVYNMGNSFLTELCKSSNTYDGVGGYYYNICSDSDKKISTQLYDNITDYLYSKAPKFVVWPYDGYLDTPPVFFEEIPDPLPECSVSGYPVSIQFNSHKIDKSSFNLISFLLYDKNGNVVNDVKLLDSENDPNNELDSYEFALMPLSRLNWNEQYKAEVKYSEKGMENTVSWVFYTRKLDSSYFLITDNSQKIKIKPGETYYLYFKPLNCNDFVSSIQYQTNAQQVETSFFDGNTLKIFVKGNVGEKVIICTDNSKTVEIELADKESESVVEPSSDYCGYLNGNFIYLPCVNVGDDSYALVFQYWKDLMFQLTDYNKVENQKYEKCGVYDVQTNELFYPCIKINNMNLWAKFKYSGNGLIFEVSDYGE